MEVNLGILISAFGLAISSGILVITYYRWVHLPRSKRKSEERLIEKKKIRQRQDAFAHCKWNTEQNLKRVEQNDFSTLDVSSWGLPEQFATKVKKYIEKFQLCSDLVVACQNSIQLTLKAIAMKELKHTMEYYDLAEALRPEALVSRYINGEEVTKRWIEKTYPHLFSDIMKNLKEKERKLDEFFIIINREFQNDRILERFRKAKKSLIELGQKIVKDCLEQTELLQKGLSKYSDIQEEEQM